jgi:hypothetical protein
VWTTGSSEGDACDVQRKFAWCPSGRLMNESQAADARFWAKPPDGTASAQRCLQLNYDAAAGATLATAHCSADKKSFVCQVCLFEKVFHIEDEMRLLSPSFENIANERLEGWVT